jgi:hypothetical protein
MSRSISAAVLALAAVLAFAAAASAAPADFDRGFGGDGIVQVEGAGGSSFSPEATARMAIGSQDEVFVLYSNPAPCVGSPSECTINLALARYNADGTRDPSFGIGAGSELTVHQNPLAHSSWRLVPTGSRWSWPTTTARC